MRPWLNLIKSWWVTSRSLVLKGRSFEGAMELIESIDQGTKCCNEYCQTYNWCEYYAYNYL